MDFLSLFSRSPEKQIERARKRVKEPHGDPATRINAVIRLKEMGTPESILAMLDRFTINVSPSVQDEQEKEELLAWIVQMGSKAVPPLVQFLKRERQVYWPARALRSILPSEDFAEAVAGVLRFHWENPPASSDPIAQLIRLLEDIRVPRLFQTIQLFLEHESDDVRLAALDHLLGHSEEESREAVLQCYLDSEDRPRVRNHILERFSEKEWRVHGFRPRIEETLPQGYALTREGKVRPVGSKE